MSAKRLQLVHPGGAVEFWPGLQKRYDLDVEEELSGARI